MKWQILFFSRTNKFKVVFPNGGEFACNDTVKTIAKVRFASVSHLLLHSNTWSSIFCFVVTITTLHFYERVYVTLMSVGIWISSPLIQPAHCYDELISISIRSFVTKNLTIIRSKELSLMVYLYLRWKASCLSTLFNFGPFWEMTRWRGMDILHLDPWHGADVQW